MSIKNQEQMLSVGIILFLLLLPRIVFGSIHAIENCLLNKKTLKAGGWIKYDVKTETWKQKALKQFVGTYFYIMLFTEDKGQNEYPDSAYWIGKDAVYAGIFILFFSIIVLVAFSWAFYDIYINW